MQALHRNSSLVGSCSTSCSQQSVSRLPVRSLLPSESTAGQRIHASLSCSTSTSKVTSSRPSPTRVCAGKLDDMPLFGSSSSSLSGKPSSGKDGKPESKPKLDDIPLESEVNMDYTALRDFLKAGDWRKAEDETRALLIRLAGEDALKRGWVYFTEVKSISVTDFLTIDKLWRTASNNKFGYSVQKEIFSQCQKRWAKFFKQIGWVQGENNNYRKWPMEFIYSMDAPRGHLPLTNALRGTQLFQAILDHPAWNKPAKKSIDEIAKEAGKDTLKF